MIRLLSKSGCVQCTATSKAMDAKGINYQVIDLGEDAQPAHYEMVRSKC